MAVIGKSYKRLKKTWRFFDNSGLNIVLVCVQINASEDDNQYLRET